MMKMQPFIVIELVALLLFSNYVFFLLEALRFKIKYRLVYETKWCISSYSFRNKSFGVIYCFGNPKLHHYGMKIQIPARSSLSSTHQKVIYWSNRKLYDFISSTSIHKWFLSILLMLCHSSDNNNWSYHRIGC